jgi:hypothetical protein
VHYTEAARLSALAPYGSIDQHVDQNLPATGGSTVSAEFLNALMFEVARVVEYAGLTIEVDGATDRTNGFEQMAEAIFESAAIDTAALTDEAVTDAKIYDVSLDKFSEGQADLEYVTGTSTYHLDLDTIDPNFWLRFSLINSATSTEEQTRLSPQRLLLRHYDNSVVTEYCALTSNELLIIDYTAAGVETSRAKLAADGLFFSDAGKSIKHYIAVAADITFAWDAVRTDYVITWVTDLPNTALVLMAQYSYQGVPYRVVRNKEGTVEFIADGDYLRVYVRYDADPSASIVGTAYLSVIYSDS